MKDTLWEYNKRIRYFPKQRANISLYLDTAELKGLREGGIFFTDRYYHLDSFSIFLIKLKTLLFIFFFVFDINIKDAKIIF